MMQTTAPHFNPHYLHFGDHYAVLSNMEIILKIQSYVSELVCAVLGSTVYSSPECR